MQTKRCNECKIEKLIYQFHRNKCTSDGRQTYCKSCMKERLALWHEQNPEKRSKYMAKQREKNRIANDKQA